MTDVHLFILAFLTAPTLILANAANSTAVTVLQSLNNQLPLVARIGQPYSWTISPLTFNYAGGGSLNYTTSALPGWVSFDASTQTFRGTPSVNDVGYPEIILTAHAAESSASSKFTICVTRNPAPTLKLPLEQQFVPNSRSLSSVYFLRNSSAINTPHPALRIPRKWSFSIGMESNMFLDAPRIFYELRLANGSAIPDYLNFNSRTVTLDGVIPPAEKFPQPSVISCVLHASDQEGYTATLLPFDLVVADHELSLSQTVSSLPTINITIASPFVASLSSAVDYMGVLVDGDPIQPLNISSLDIDVSNYPWLQYDKASRTLFGTPGVDVTGTSPALPVTLTTTFNQRIATSVSLNLVESYFVLPDLPSLHVSQGDTIVASLTPWFSETNSRPGYDGTSLLASYDPTAAGDFLYFDERSANVTGTIPSDYHSASDHITLSFTAYSNITHTTSHTSLAIYVPNTGNTQSLAPSRADGLGDDAHKKLVLALGLSFGLIGGLCVLAGVFAIVRRWAKVEDTAIVGEEGQLALSEKDQRWYGMGLSPGGTRVIEKEAISKPVAFAKPRGPRPQYGGLGLRRVSERDQGNTDSQEHLVGQGVMRKREFLARIKETVRQVSNKYSRKQDLNSNRPAIGKPILVSSTRASANHPEVVVHSSSSNPFEDSMAPSRPGSTFLSSPSGSTAEQSIPRRRADFGGPRNPAQVHFKEGLLARHPSTGSAGDVSYRSGKSGVSADSVFETEIGPQTRPRLVPFTSSTRVPVPDPDAVVFTSNRIASQRAKVCKTDFGENCEDTGIKASDTADDLSMGLHYMRSLGTDQPAPGNGGGNGSSLSNVRSSFTSLESSHVGHKTGMEMSVTKVLIRVGERFKFRVPIFPASGTPAESYVVKLVSGEVLPRFIQPDLSGISTKGVLELSGIATFRDLGGLNVGVYTNTGVCVASVIIEVVGK